jgi:hypothetical protein
MAANKKAAKKADSEAQGSRRGDLISTGTNRLFVRRNELAATLWTAASGSWKSSN